VWTCGGEMSDLSPQSGPKAHIDQVTVNRASFCSAQAVRRRRRHQAKRVRPREPCQRAHRCVLSKEGVPAGFGGLVLRVLINGFAAHRTKPNMNPPSAVPDVTETGT